MCNVLHLVWRVWKSHSLIARMVSKHFVAVHIIHMKNIPSVIAQFGTTKSRFFDKFSTPCAILFFSSLHFFFLYFSSFFFSDAFHSCLGLICGWTLLVFELCYSAKMSNNYEIDVKLFSFAKTCAFSMKSHWMEVNEKDNDDDESIVWQKWNVFSRSVELIQNASAEMKKFRRRKIFIGKV